MEVDRLLELAHDLRAKRIETDEEGLELLAVGQVVAARPARDAIVRVDADERGLLVGARDRVPGSVERWVELDAVAPCLHRRDPHQLPP